MTDIEFNINIIGNDGHQFLDPSEVELFIDATRSEMREHILSRVGGMVCDQHGKPAKVIVNGEYSLANEQLDLQYNVEACCNTMTMKVASLLSR